MKTIINPDPLVLKLSGSTDFSDISKVRLSQFAVPYSIDNNKLLYNTLTKECLLLSDEEYKTFMAGNFKYDPEQSFSKYLAEHRFLSASDQECQTYCSLISLIRTIIRKDKISTYTILPTTFCNARCFYCYELNYHFTRMNDDTKAKVIQFIKDTHAENEIKIRWFGGEPLLGKDTIGSITDQLHQEGILFHSEMITNGSLFTEELIQKAKTQWNLKRVQITLDGTEEEYNQRKNYFQSEPSPFKTVICNIHLLQKAGIKVTIRLNVDLNNTEDLCDLQHYLSEQFIDKNGISVYCNPIFDEMNSEKCDDVFYECIKLEGKFNESGFRIHSFSTQGKLRPYHCMAADPSCITIDPKGRLYGCEHCDEQSLLTSEMTGNIPSRKSMITIDDVTPECRSCAYLPVCTEFTDCPDVVHSCKKIREMQTTKQLSAFIKRTHSI